MFLKDFRNIFGHSCVDIVNGEVDIILCSSLIYTHIKLLTRGSKHRGLVGLVHIEWTTILLLEHVFPSIPLLSDSPILVGQQMFPCDIMSKQGHRKLSYHSSLRIIFKVESKKFNSKSPKILTIYSKQKNKRRTKSVGKFSKCLVILIPI